MRVGPAWIFDFMLEAESNCGIVSLGHVFGQKQLGIDVLLMMAFSSWEACRNVSLVLYFSCAFLLVQIP